MRRLTERQQIALRLLANMAFVSTRTSASMPSLERRGLVRGWRDFSAGFQGGIKRWEITDEGRAEADRLRQAEDASC